MSRQSSIQAVAAADPPPASSACNRPKLVNGATERAGGMQWLAKELFTDVLQNGFQVAHIVALSTELLDLTANLFRLHTAANEAQSQEQAEVKPEEGHLTLSSATAHDCARVIDAWDETAELRSVRVALPPERARAHQRPGQVVTLRAAGQVGYFALASAPSSEGIADLLLKRGGQVADSAIANAAPASTLEISTPFGSGFPVEEARGRHAILFATGSGIAPIRALVQHVLRHRSEFGRVTLFYGQRRGGDFAYVREHLAWERGGVRVVLCPSTEIGTWSGVRGRVHEVARSTCFGGASLQNAVIFVSGMRTMVDDLKATLSAAGLPPTRVHLNF